MADTYAAATPTKRTGEQELSQINAQLRANPEYIAFLQSMGVNPSGPIKLTDRQREQAKRYLASQGVPLQGGMEIDPAGNINQNEGVGKWAKDWRTYAAIGVAVAGLGVAGIGPAAGILSGGAAATPAAVGGSIPYVPGGLAMGMPAPAAAAVGGGATAAAGGGAMSKLWGAAKNNAGSLIGAAGSAFGSAADASAQNRGVQLEADIARAQLEQQAERDYNDSMFRREEEGRAKQKNAWELMNRASYVQNATGKAPGFAGQYSRDIAAPTPERKAAAGGVFTDMSKHLAEGNTLEMPRRVGTDVQVQEPGGMEKIGGWLGPGLTAGANIWQLLAQQKRGG